MNIAIYARVSSEKQAKEGTIESQLEALRELGCGEAQGYLYGRPMNQANITEWLQRNHS